MNLKKLLAAALALCLLLSLVPAASAAEINDLGDLIERLAPQLDGGLEDLTDWLKDGATAIEPELRELLRQMSNEDFFQEIRELAELDDEALRSKIRTVGTQYGFSLSEEQVQQLMHLCRTVEKLDPKLLTERIESLRDTVETPGGLRGVWDSVVKTFKSAVNWVTEKARSIFG